MNRGTIAFVSMLALAGVALYVGHEERAKKQTIETGPPGAHIPPSVLPSGYPPPASLPPGSTNVSVFMDKKLIDGREVPLFYRLQDGKLELCIYGALTREEGAILSAALPPGTKLAWQTPMSQGGPIVMQTKPHPNDQWVNGQWQTPGSPIEKR